MTEGSDDYEPRRAAVDDQQPTLAQRALKVHSMVGDIFTRKNTWLLVSLIAVGLIGLFGGWDKVAEAEHVTPSVKPGQVAVATPFHVTVSKAVHMTELPGLGKADDGSRYLLVAVDVTTDNPTPVPSGVLAEAATLNVKGLATTALRSGPRVNPPMVLRVADALSQREFQPDLPSTVALVWQQRTSEPPPTSLTLTWSSHTWRASSLDQGMGWRDPTPVAQVTVPVTEGKEA